MESDFTLASRGDGNYSARFYEALSLGVVPIIPDTDIVLPFEEVIPYDEFIVRIPLDSLNKAPLIVSSFYEENKDNWNLIQEKARSYFTRYLSPASFFSVFFMKIKEELDLKK